MKKITEFNNLVGNIMLFPGMSVYYHFLEAAVFVAQGHFFICSHKKLHSPYLPDLAVWIIKLSTVIRAKVSFFPQLAPSPTVWISDARL